MAEMKITVTSVLSGKVMELKKVPSESVIIQDLTMRSMAYFSQTLEATYTSAEDIVVVLDGNCGGLMVQVKELFCLKISTQDQALLRLEV